MNNSVNKEIYKDPIKISIILLSLIVFIMLILIVNNELRKRNDTAKGRLKKYVAISEFIFDSKNRRFIDIKFDKPISRVENMGILGRDPAMLVLILAAIGFGKIPIPFVLNLQGGLRMLLTIK